MARSALAGVEDFRRRLDAISDTRMMLGTIGLRAVAYSKQNVHRRTGNLGRTIRLGKVTEEYVEVLAGGQSKVGYAAAEELGSKPHIIRPRRAKALAWGGSRTLSGRLRKGARPTTFAAMVRHPGQPPHPYLVPGIKRALRDAGLKVQIRDAWNRAA